MSAKSSPGEFWLGIFGFAVSIACLLRMAGLIEAFPGERSLIGMNQARLEIPAIDKLEELINPRFDDRHNWANRVEDEDKRRWQSLSMETRDAIRRYTDAQLQRDYEESEWE